MRRFLIVCVLLLFGAGLLAMPVSANSPPSAEFGGVVYSPLESILVVALMILAILTPIGLTCLSEWVVTLFFDLDKSDRRLVLLTNLISQSLMWAVILLGFFVGGVEFAEFYMQHYVIIIIVLEVLIYAGEFLWYCKKLVLHPWPICLLLSVVANTVSMLLGMLYYRIV